MAKQFFNELKKIKDGDSLDLGENIVIKADRDKAESLDLNEDEKGFVVYISGKEVGSVSAYKDAEIQYFSNRKSEDTEVNNMRELIQAIKIKS